MIKGQHADSTNRAQKCLNSQQVWPKLAPVNEEPKPHSRNRTLGTVKQECCQRTKRVQVAHEQARGEIMYKEVFVMQAAVVPPVPNDKRRQYWPSEVHHWVKLLKEVEPRKNSWVWTLRMQHLKPTPSWPPRSLEGYYSHVGFQVSQDPEQQLDWKKEVQKTPLRLWGPCDQGMELCKEEGRF